MRDVIYECSWVHLCQWIIEHLQTRKGKFLQMRLFICHSYLIIHFILQKQFLLPPPINVTKSLAELKLSQSFKSFYSWTGSVHACSSVLSFEVDKDPLSCSYMVFYLSSGNKGKFYSQSVSVHFSPKLEVPW